MPATFVLNRNHVIYSLTGHVVSFRRDVETAVPDAVIPEAVAIGAERVDKKQGALVTDESDLPPPMADNVKDAKVMEAIKMMFERNVRGDFGGGGYPSHKVLSGLVGFEVDVRMRDRLWDEFQKRRAELAEQA